MVDFIKAIAKSNYLKIRDHEQLDFEIRANAKTGEIKNFQEAVFKNIKFKSFDTGRLQISGSLHKFFNGGQHNWNRFTIQNVIEVLNELSSVFDLKLIDFQIVNIEFGVNLILNDSVSLILNGLLEHKGKPFDLLYGGYYRQCRHNEMIIKAYDKSNQYSLPFEVFRFELKYVKSRSFALYNCEHLACLLHEWPQRRETAKQELIKRWEEVIFYDANTRLFTAKEHALYSNHLYWKDLSKMTKSRKVRKVNCIYNSEPASTRNRTRDLIIKEMNEL